MLSRETCYIQVGYVEYCSLLQNYHFTWAISKKFRSKYLKTEQCFGCSNCMSSNKKNYFWVLDRHGDCLQTLSRPSLVSYFFGSYLEPLLMSRFANGNILLAPSRFIRQFKMNIQNLFFFFCKNCHSRCHINWIQDFHLMLYLNHIFFWLNNGKNAGPYITKL